MKTNYLVSGKELKRMMLKECVRRTLDEVSAEWGRNPVADDYLERGDNPKIKSNLIHLSRAMNDATMEVLKIQNEIRECGFSGDPESLERLHELELRLTDAIDNLQKVSERLRHVTNAISRLGTVPIY